MPTRPDPSRTRARRTILAGATMVAVVAVAPSSLAGCSSGDGAGSAGGRTAAENSTTTTTMPASAAAYFAAMAEGGAAGAMKMAGAAAPGSPARRYAEHLALLAGLGVTPAPPWGPAAGTPPTTAAPAPPDTTAAPAAAPATVAAPPPSTAPPSTAPPTTAPPPTTVPPPPPPPRAEPDGDGFRVCSGTTCERYDDLSFTDGLVADFDRDGRPLTEVFAMPGPPVVHDGLTVVLTGASADSVGKLVVTLRAGNGSATRWNLAYVQRFTAGAVGHDNAGAMVGPSALEPGQSADLALPFPGAVLPGTVHLTTFLGSTSDPAAKVVYFDLPAGSPPG